MNKNEVFEQERDKLLKIFQKTDENIQKLAEGLIFEASELKADLYELNLIKNETGYVKIHPKNKDIQKSTEVGRTILKLQSSYANIIKVLNSLLTRNLIEEDDELDQFLKNRKKNNNGIY